MFQRSDLACIKETLESSSFISRLTTEQMRARKCKANYIYIYRSRSNNFRLLISDKDNTGRTAVPLLFPLSIPRIIRSRIIVTVIVIEALYISVIYLENLFL